MNDIRNLLRETDPVAREPRPSPETLTEMRRAVLAVARMTPATPVWGRQLTLAASLTVMVLAAVVAASRVPSAPSGPDASSSVPTAVSGQGTQVQFSTPGGTRIVWTLDPGFQLGETRR